MPNIKVISGSTHPDYALKICEKLRIPICKTTIKRFHDSEVYVKINEKVRGDDVFIIQPTVNF